MKKLNLIMAALAIAAQDNKFNFGGGNLSDDDIQRELMRIQSMNYHNYNNNKSAFGFTADELAGNPALTKLLMALGNRSFDADAMNFDADAMNFGGLSGFGFSVDEMLDPSYLISKNRMHYSAQEIAAANLTTFKTRIIYTPVAAVPEPVDIQLFGMTFGLNFTYDVNGNVVFTNAGGDYVTIQGLTRSMQQLYNVTDTEPFRLAFIRLTPQSTTQLDNPITVKNETQWNSGKFNEINPDIYNDPYQYQQLNIDVPFNILIDKKNGFQWTVDPDQTSPGCGMALFISQQLKPADALDGKHPVRNLGGGKTPTFSIPGISGGIKTQLAALANHPAVQNLIAATPLLKR